MNKLTSLDEENNQKKRLLRA